MPNTAMPPEVTFLISGTVFGLTGGLMPGPLLTLVISETLRHNVREGLKVSIAPLLTDLPIVLVCILFISRLSDIHYGLGVISLMGGAFLGYLGYEGITFRGVDLDSDHIKPRSLRKGAVTNLLNPSPYLFWISVGAPSVIEAKSSGLASVFLFILCFYVFLVGSKIVIAVIIGRSREFLKSSNYVRAIRSLGIVLLVFAALFFKNGLKLLGWGLPWP